MMPIHGGQGPDELQERHRDWNMHALDNNPGVLLAALERANEAILIVDDDLRVNHFNAAAELIWGMDRAEVLGGHASCLGLSDLHKMQDTSVGAVDLAGE